jgi:heat shock protein HspQ
MRVVEQEVSSMGRAGSCINLRSFRVGQNVYHPNFGTRGKVIEVDRDTLHIQEKDEDGNLLEMYRVVPKEAFAAWESED